ncbi:MAG: transketolase [Acidimicrobiales bacterium]
MRTTQRSADRASDLAVDRAPNADPVGAAGLARQLRVDSIRCSTAAGSGHPTSSLSAADLAAVLMLDHLRYDWSDPERRDNDHLIFSKGHASPLLYSMWRAAGVIGEDELMRGYRRFGGRLQGHPTPVLPWVDVATGSLGQGLPVGVGIALASQRLDHAPSRVWVLCGDSELTEGSIWEALDRASHEQLDHLTVLVDVNRLGQRGPTELGWQLSTHAQRVSAFGCRAIVIDCHDLAAIDEAMTEATTTQGRPTVILARTVKGRGVPEIEDAEGWHGKPLPAEMADAAIAALGGRTDLVVRGPLPARHRAGRSIVSNPPSPDGRHPQVHPPLTRPVYEVGREVATRRAFGEGIAALARRPDVVVVDAEVGNSTYAELFGAVAPDRYFQAYIAEQQLVATAIGLGVRGYTAFASTFAAFLSRAYDFIRMDGISQVPLRLVGSHAGVEIGADGPSQMALEDLASLRAVEGSTVLYPSDAPSTVALVEAMAEASGVSYLRTTRGAYPVLYGPDERFPIGGSKLHGADPADQVALIGAGVTLHECLRAQRVLADLDVRARVIDLYSVKPVDLDRLIEAARITGGHLVMVEDHHPEGGIGAAVLEALATVEQDHLHVAHLAVRELPGSGSSQQLLNAAGLTAPYIVEAARALCRCRTGHR